MGQYRYVPTHLLPRTTANLLSPSLVRRTGSKVSTPPLPYPVDCPHSRCTSAHQRVCRAAAAAITVAPPPPPPATSPAQQQQQQRQQQLQQRRHHHPPRHRRNSSSSSSNGSTTTTTTTTPATSLAQPQRRQDRHHHYPPHHGTAAAAMSPPLPDHLQWRLLAMRRRPPSYILYVINPLAACKPYSPCILFTYLLIYLLYFYYFNEDSICIYNQYQLILSHHLCLQ